MLQRVYEQAAAANTLDNVVVATDDERIAKHAATFGAKALITSPSHPSGTDRCYEAYTLLGEAYDYVINIQGDEPFLDPEQINSLASACNGTVEIATQMTLCKSHDVLFDTGEVKIALSESNDALYFSRQVIPFFKNLHEQEWHLHHKYYRHVGMYAYRTDILGKIAALKPSALEQAESLEQLRWLQHGYRIRCVETDFDSHCVDTPEDIDKVLRLMNLA